MEQEDKAHEISQHGFLLMFLFGYVIINYCLLLNFKAIDKIDLSNKGSV